MNDIELLNNKTKRAPVLFCVDTSKSMDILLPGDNITGTGQYVLNEAGTEQIEIGAGGKSYLEATNEKIAEFLSLVSSNAKTKYRVDISVVKFGETIEQVCDFAPAQNINLNGELDIPSGTSNLCEAISCSLELIKNRYKQYEEMSIQSYPSRIIILTDGEITDENKLMRIKSVISGLSKKLKPFVYIVSISNNISSLFKIKEATEGEIIPFTKDNFERFFSFIINSVSVHPNEKGQYNPRDMVRISGNTSR